eukprot:gene3712-13780_t
MDLDISDLEKLKKAPNRAGPFRPTARSRPATTTASRPVTSTPNTQAATTVRASTAVTAPPPVTVPAARPTPVPAAAAAAVRHVPSATLVEGLIDPQEASYSIAGRQPAASAVLLSLGASLRVADANTSAGNLLDVDDLAAVQSKVRKFAPAAARRPKAAPKGASPTTSAQLNGQPAPPTSIGSTATQGGDQLQTGELPNALSQKGASSKRPKPVSQAPSNQKPTQAQAAVAGPEPTSATLPLEKKAKGRPRKTQGGPDVSDREDSYQATSSGSGSETESDLEHGGSPPKKKAKVKVKAPPKAKPPPKPKKIKPVKEVVDSPEGDSPQPKKRGRPKGSTKAKKEALLRSQQGEKEGDCVEEAPGLTKVTGKELAVVKKRLVQTGMVNKDKVKNAKADLHTPVDLDTCSIRRIIAKSEVSGEGKGTMTAHFISCNSWQGAKGCGGARASHAAAAEMASGGPRLQIVNGQIVVDNSSLTIQAQQTDIQTYQRVEEEGRFLNSQTYSNMLARERWSETETELFYRSIAHFGTDFGLIAKLFPSRDRKHIKNKFNMELKAHATRVNSTLKGGSKDPAETRLLYTIIKRNLGLPTGLEEGGSADPAAAPAAPPSAVNQPTLLDKAAGESADPGDMGAASGAGKMLPPPNPADGGATQAYTRTKGPNLLAARPPRQSEAEPPKAVQETVPAPVEAAHAYMGDDEMDPEDMGYY